MGGGSLLHILVTVVSIHSYIDPHIHSHAAEGLACETTFVFFLGLGLGEVNCKHSNNLNMQPSVILDPKQD